MSGYDYFKEVVFKKYADFNGRARRSEYWYFILFNFILSIVATIIDFINGTGLGETGIISGILALALFIPSLAVAVRRLHDTGRSGWWLLILFTIIGILVLLYFLVEDSEPGGNEYGPNPKTGDGDNLTDHLVDIV